jgi:hypothetical protein
MSNGSGYLLKILPFDRGIFPDQNIGIEERIGGVQLRMGIDLGVLILGILILTSPIRGKF